MKYGVIIVTYNRIDLLKECIHACTIQSLPFEKIIVVNNASTDGTKEYLETILNPQIEIHNLLSNTGGSGGFSYGVKVAEKSNLDYVLLIDDDAIIDANFNKSINDEILKECDTIIAYSGTVITDGVIKANHRKHLRNQFYFSEVWSDLSEYNQPFFDYDISSFCGLYIPTNIIGKIGYPSEDFFVWFDDTEYSLRLRKYGRIRNVNGATLNHKTLNGKVENKITWKNYYGERNKLVTIKWHFYPQYYFEVFKKLIRIVRYNLLFLVSRNEEYKVLSKILYDAVIDSSKGVLGKSKKYLPGKELTHNV